MTTKKDKDAYTLGDLDDANEAATVAAFCIDSALAAGASRARIAQLKRAYDAAEAHASEVAEATSLDNWELTFTPVSCGPEVAS